MTRKGGKRIIHFYNQNGEINSVIHFLEEIQKKINYLNLNCTVEGKDIKVTIFGTRDMQILAIERLKELAERFLA
jgi:hypothetical protein